MLTHAPSAANLPADCINLGQGYMNFAPPEWIRTAAEEALNAVATNHYSHPKGRIRLREALKAHYSPELGRDLDVESEILVTSGANEGELVYPTYANHFLIGRAQASTPSSLPSWNRAMRSSCSNRSLISTCPRSLSMAVCRSMSLSTPPQAMASRAATNGPLTSMNSGEWSWRSRWTMSSAV